MRYLLLFCIALICLFATTPVQAHEECLQCDEFGNYTSAYRSLERAALEQRYYRRVEHPNQVRTLKAEIKFSAARVDALRRINTSYRPFTRFSTGNPLTLTVERTRLDLLREEIYLRELREQLRLEYRFHRMRMQNYSHQIQASAALLSQASLDPTKSKIKIVSHSAEFPEKN